MYNSSYSSIIGGCCNRQSYSELSSILGGYCNCTYGGDCSTILGGYGNCISGYDSDSRGSSILGGNYNSLYNGACRSSIIGGYSNEIECYSCDSSIIGGCNNGICCDSCQSAVIGGCNNYMCCSCNSVILGGQGLDICERNNSVFLNATTYLKQTVESAEDISVTTSNVSVSFLDGSIKYLSSLSNDFQVDFTDFPDPSYANSVITYTLILNQGATPYMITDLTINGGSVVTIKWYNGNVPSGTANQVDTIGLMFIYNNTGVLSQVLGQAGTFA